MDERGRPDVARWRWGAAALVAGLLLRVFFVHIHPRFVGDTLTYGDLAHNMLAHQVYGVTEDRVRSTLIRLPGYPLFLAACFVLFGNANYLAVVWVQVVMDLASCALLGMLAVRLMGRRSGLTVLWLAALCPFTANYAAAALTETLSLFCVTLGFFGLERWLSRWRGGKRGLVWAGVVGLALAGAVLVRPDEGLLAAAVVPVMVWVGLRGGRRGLMPAVVASMVVVLSLSVWAGGNWRTFHVIQPLAPKYANDPGEAVNYGFQRWYRTWGIEFKSTVDVYWNYDGNLMSLGDLPPRAIEGGEQRAETVAVYAAYNEVSSATPEIDAAIMRIADQRVAAHPLRYYLVLPVAREMNMWLRPRTELMKMPVDWWAWRVHPGRSVFEVAYALLDVGYLVLGMIGLWRWFAHVSESRHGAPIFWGMVGFVALRCVLLLTLDNSEPRYTLECFPVVIVLAGFALAGRSRVASD